MGPGHGEHGDLTDTIEAFAKGNFVNSQVTTQLAPPPIGNRIFRFTLDNNPFLTPAAKAALNSLGSTTAYSIPAGSAPYAAGTYTDVDTDGDDLLDIVTGTFNRRLSEVGPQVSQFNFFGFQMQTGLRGKLDVINGQWESYFQYGNAHGSNSLLGDTSLARTQQGLLLTTNSTTGVTTCTDPSGFVSGDTENFFSLPAGAIGFALGAEYREEQFEFRPSQDLAVGNLTGFNASPPVAGGFDVYELYSEALVPILKTRRDLQPDQVRRQVRHPLRQPDPAPQAAHDLQLVVRRLWCERGVELPG
ncbi:hypothetical protein [Phenylobacterium sp.]|uniref:hypothetical protein n=1 Tax=Phenylobacterium sp. TaxID=1871053 RepID=UPI00398320B1